MLDLIAIAHTCAAEIETSTMMRVIAVESGGNPYAIGVVDGKLEWQPRTRGEAIATARMLDQNGLNYSVGLGQVNKHNFAKYGLTLERAFEPCANLRAAAAILKACFLRARAGKTTRKEVQRALRDAFSCYYSGNFSTGYRFGYVDKVVTARPLVRPQIHTAGGKPRGKTFFPKTK